MKQYKDGGQIAKDILAQLGGMNRLNAMTGAYNFVDLGNGLSFRIKNQRANFIKITVNGSDLYDLEVGRIRGDKYTVVAEENDLFEVMLKPKIEKITGMTLTMPRVIGFNYKKGGSIAAQNKQMVAVKAKEIQHHAIELMEALQGNDEVPAWVVAKIERSATDISDAAHYLEGVEGEEYDEEQYDIVELERGEKPEGDYGIDGFAKGGTITFSKYTDVNKPMIGDKFKSIGDTTNGIVYEISNSGNEFKLKDEYGNENNTWYHINSTGKAKISRSKEAFAMGGSTFEQKVSAISKRLEGSEVKRKYRKEFGDRYDKKEATEAAKRIAGSMVAKSKMAVGGRIKTLEVGQVFVLPNNEEIEIVRLFTENIDEEWVEYLRAGKSNENSVKMLRIFLNNFKAKLKMANGGEIIIDMDLHDAVIYEDEVHYISEEDGVIGLKYMKSGAWGSSHPFTPLSEIDIDKDVRDMMGRKVRIKNHYDKGGEMDTAWKSATSIKYKTKKEALKYVSLSKNNNESNKQYRNFRIEKIDYGDKLNDGYVVKFEYRDNMAKGGSIPPIDMEEVEKSAIFYTDESRWSTKPTIKKFEDELIEYGELKEQLENNQIKPYKIIGSGFKPQFARHLAFKYINQQMLVAKRAIEILKERG